MYLTRCVLTAVFLLTAMYAVAADNPRSSPLAVHMAHMMEGSAEWRTANPDHERGSASSPKEFGVNWRWGTHQHHLIGELVGIYEDGRVAPYQTLYAVYNPVTERVVMQQIGWDGTFMSGDAEVRREALRDGEFENVDMIEYRPDGTAKITRHTVVIKDKRTQQMDVYEKGEDGEWALKRQWTWTLL